MGGWGEWEVGVFVLSVDKTENTIGAGLIYFYQTVKIRTSES